ncbi:MAG: hypothetical protein KKG33_09780 [candidate division Zixibacteria bacterium]|nr:hypothetical protein [candidate division Zixibacteria bacterium]MBU1470410.1 hypothetical protein [candidate division Zixibacteria bacterium]MBU2625837.1 hypothetical protein [candidate division Zixibacteria bacterium]
MNAGKINFGLVLIIIGAAALAVNLDLMDWTVYLELLDLWPVLLIAAGIGMIFKRLPAPQFAYLSSILILAVGAYVLYSNYEIYAGVASERTTGVDLSQLSDEISGIEFDIDIDDCDMTVGGSASSVVRCSYSDFPGKPSIEFDTVSDVARVSLKEGKIPGISFFHVDSYQFDWNVKLYDKLPISLNLDCRDCDLRLNLDGLQVDKLVSRTPYSQVDLRLGTLRPDVNIAMKAHRSDLQVRIPDSVGVEILDPGTFSEYYVGDIDFVRDGARLVTSNFDSAAVKYHFDFDDEAKILRMVHY